VDEVERDLDQCLRELRTVDRNNTVAVASIEYRIGRLRERKAVLERGAP
jgi:hypothetical protein